MSSRTLGWRWNIDTTAVRARLFYIYTLDWAVERTDGRAAGVRKRGEYMIRWTLEYEEEGEGADDQDDGDGQPDNQ